jgi:hypothetical protein
MRPIALGLLWALLASAQNAEPQEEFSTVSGRVVNAVTGEPIAKASLRLMRVVVRGGQLGYLELGQNYAAVSSATGAFDLTQVEPGRYRLFVSRNGFVTLEYGAAGSRTMGTVLDLEAVQDLDQLDLRMTPHGVLTGRVVDGDGEPVQDATIVLLCMKYIDGRRALTCALVGGPNVAVARTDDRGEYRIYGLPPGSYYLYATQEASSQLPVAAKTKEGYVPVYYPAAYEASGAAPILVEAGSEVRADMAFRKAPTVRVSGQALVEVPGESVLTGVSFQRRLDYVEGDAHIQMRSHRALFSAEGKFEILNLTPGVYVATAVARVGARSLAGRSLVHVSGEAMEGVAIRIGEGYSLSGAIALEDGPQDDLSRLNFQLVPQRPLDLNARLRRERTAEDRSFRTAGLDPDVYQVQFDRLPEGFYVKSVKVGGADVTYEGVDLSRGSVEDVEIQLSRKAGLVSGAVRNADTGEAALGSTVILVPESPQRRQAPWLYSQAVVDQYGRFEITSVAPGEYRAYAWEEIESTAWMDSEFMRPLRTKGKPISVAEDSEVGIQLDVIPVEEPQNSR